MKLHFMNAANKDKGFTILFAVVISALVLSIGLSIANITLKQVQLSSSGRESQIAFYAADSGSECALYYDITVKAFPDENYTPDPTIAFSPDTATCGTAPIELSGIPTENETTFSVTYGTYCSLVTIIKSAPDAEGVIDTTILSRGFNTCDDSNPRKLERGLQITY